MYHYDQPSPARWFGVGFGVASMLAAIAAPMIWQTARRPLLRAADDLRTQIEVHARETAMVRTELRDLEALERQARDDADRLMLALDDLPRPIFPEPPPPEPPPAPPAAAPASPPGPELRRLQDYAAALREALGGRDEALAAYEARDALQASLAARLQDALDAAAVRADRAEARLEETETVLASAVRPPAPRRWGLGITCGLGAAGASGLAPACSLGVTLRLW